MLLEGLAVYPQKGKQINNVEILPLDDGLYLTLFDIAGIRIFIAYFHFREVSRGKGDKQMFQSATWSQNSTKLFKQIKDITQYDVLFLPLFLFFSFKIFPI